jgi:hypothetical protein
MKTPYYILIALTTLFLNLASAVGATFYLAPNGVDSASRSGSNSSPWKTLPYAQTRMATGDDLILKAGVYPISATQRITKSGTSTNPMEIKAATGALVYLDGAGITRDYETMLYIDGSYVQFKNIELRNNIRGAGLLIRGSYVTVENCKAYNHGLTGIQIHGYEANSWETTPFGCTLRYCTVYNCCTMNNPNAINYKGWRELGYNWPFAIGAYVAREARVLNCWASDNYGEGIVLARVRGGTSEISNCQARDNYSVNIYCDSVSGVSNRWASIRNNSAWTTFNPTYFRYAGAPSLNFVISAENYDTIANANGVILGSNPTNYVQVVGNSGTDGGHNFAILDVYNVGKGISNVWIDGNTATRSTWGNLRLDSSPNIYNISFGTNSGF